MNRSEQAEYLFRMDAKANGVVIIGKYVTSNIPVHCLCPEGHNCYPRPSAIAKGEGWCSICRYPKIAKKRKAPAEKRFRDKAAQDGVIIIGDYINKDVPVLVICPNGHESHPAPNNIARGQGWCRTCAGFDPIEATKRFMNRAAQDGITILGEYVNVNTPIHVRCPEGHDDYPRPTWIARGRGWCRVCSGTDPVTAKRRFMNRAAQDGIIVIGEYINKDTPVHVICPAGHESHPAPNNIARGQGWCLECTQSHNVLYVVKNETTVKFGISSGEGITRLANHRTDGLTDEVRLFTGLPQGEARKTENLIKAALKDAKWTPVQGKEYYPVEALALILDVIDGAMAILGITNQVYDWSEVIGEPVEFLTKSDAHSIWRD